MKYILGLLILLAFSGSFAAQSKTSEDAAESRTIVALNEIASLSFPEINRDKLKVKVFRSRDSFFKARYSVVRFITFQKMRHLVFVNPAAFDRGLPETAFRSILAHELAHVSYYTRKNRFQLMGLIRLAGSGARTGFERKADLEAIVKGYGFGLIEYRQWLYRQLSPAQIESKKRIYFSPDEITLIMNALSEKPELIGKWRKTVPRNINEIRNDTGDD